MKVLFLIEGWISPAPRFRVLQYLDYLAQQGVRCEVRSLHGETYPFFYHWPVTGKLYKLWKRWRRLFQIRDADRFDAVLQQRLTLPFSAFIERRLARRNPSFVFDFDDAIFQAETGPDTRREKAFREVAQRAHTVIAGSSYLAEFAGERCVVIPTVIDCQRYFPIPAPSPEKEVIIGWMGTRSNYPNFHAILSALEEVLLAHPGARLELVSDGRPPFQLPRAEHAAWSAEREVSSLQRFHIGIMPLDDTAWNRGKCAFKLIQYMAVGIPVVCSPVGANREVVRDGVDGFWAAQPQEWVSALKRLIEDPSLRKAMGESGRQRCERKYSVQSQQARFLETLRTAAARKTKDGGPPR